MTSKERLQPSALSPPRAKVDFFISHLEMNEDIKMHKFPAWNLNKNANERLRVLMMQRAGPLFISLGKHQAGVQTDGEARFDVSVSQPRRFPH